MEILEGTILKIVSKYRNGLWVLKPKLDYRLTSEDKKKLIMLE